MKRYTLLLYIATVALLFTACKDGNAFGDEYEPVLPVEVLLCPDTNHPHMIDMGLSVKWACCNVGASSPSDDGDYWSSSLYTLDALDARYISFSSSDHFTSSSHRYDGRSVRPVTE